MKFSLIVAAFLGFVAATGIVACSTHSTDPLPSPSQSASGGEQTGEVSYELRLGRTTHINSASYTLTCSGGFTKSGTIDVSKLRELEGSITGLPGGATCTLSLTAQSTNRNVTCSGSKAGLTLKCPGNRPQDENHFLVTCTRNHVGREWGDDDWKENARTFVLGAEVNLVCGSPDGGLCVPQTSCPSGDTCGTVSDGCGGTLNCGTCPPGSACGAGVGATPNTCGCVITTTCAAHGATCGTIPDGCGGTLSCGQCTGQSVCQANKCVCQPLTMCPAGQVCGTAPDGCGGNINCGACTAPQTTCNATGQCVCVPNTQCPAGQVCGSVPDGCGGNINCGTCPAGTACNQAGTCSPICPTACPPGDNCGAFDPGIVGCGPINCGTCTAPQTCGGGTPSNPNRCDCTPTTCLAQGATCGTIPNGCGGTLSCGQCSAGNACSPTNKCVCAPITTCPAGQNCDPIPDGCGGTFNCGTCTAPQQVCKFNKCTCVPLKSAAACGTNDCGTAPDGCGGTVQCGLNLGGCPFAKTCTVPTGQTAGTCQGPDLCSPTNPSNTTATCFQQRDKASSSAPTRCTACATNNGCFNPAMQGGTCEMVTGTANLFPATLPDGLTCPQVFAPLTAPISESKVCLDVLDAIFNSKCAASFQETPCLCGSTDVITCFDGTATPTGPAYDLYACDFNNTAGPTINNITTDFVVPVFGAGEANAVTLCAAAFSCDCF